MKVFASLISVMVMTQMCVAQQDEPPAPPRSDRQFIVDSGPGIGVRGYGQIEIQIPIDRYAGPTNADDTLRDAEPLIAEGSLRPWAELEIVAYDVDYDNEDQCPTGPERDPVYFNGQRVDSLRSLNSPYLYSRKFVWYRNVYQIPIQKVKFPGAPGTGGVGPTPMMNTIHIDMPTRGNTGQPCINGLVGWVKLRIGCMSPVVCVHGNSMQGDWWSRHGFVTAFAYPFLPIDNSISFPATTGKPGQNPRTFDANYLSTHLPAIARNFGVDSLHLVAHSKGGLDSRQYLENSAWSNPNGPTILSLSTLSTPHDGSMLADVQVAVHSPWTLPGTRVVQDAGAFGWSAIQWDNFPIMFRAASVAGSSNPGYPDLMLAACATFNARNVPRLPTTTQYMTFAADMDLNGSTSVDLLSEAQEMDLDDTVANAGMHAPSLEKPFLKTLDAIYQQLARTRRVSVYRIHSGDYWILSVAATTGAFVGNDILVPIPSGHGMAGGYVNVVSAQRTYSGANGRNHASIGNAGVGVDVRAAAIQVEQQIGDLTP